MYTSLLPDLIGISTKPFDTLVIAQQAGFDGLDIRIDRFADHIQTCGIKTFKNAMGNANLRPGYCTLLPGKISVDQEIWDQSIAQLPHFSRIAQALGYTRCAIVMLPFHETLDFNACFNLHVQRIQQIAPILADHNIRLGIEYVSPLTRRAEFEHQFIYNMQGTLQLLQAIDRPNIGLLLDSFHWYCAGETQADIEKLQANKIVVVHVNDAYPGRTLEEQTVFERELPGATGLIDLASFHQALSNIDYDGPVTCEPLNPRWATLAAQTVANQTRQAMEPYITPCKTIPT